LQQFYSSAGEIAREFMMLPTGQEFQARRYVRKSVRAVSEADNFNRLFK